MAALALIGSLVGAAGTVAGGVAAKNDANYEAKQMEMKAKEETAAATREAGQARTESELAMSRGQALAAASGGGAGSDAPTILKLMSGLAGQGELNSQSALAGGFSRAAGLNDSAKARRAQGKSSFLGSVIGGFGQAAKGISSAKGWG